MSTFFSLTTSFLLTASLLSGQAAQAQAPAFTSYKQFSDSLVAQFNRGAFNTAEAYGSAALRQLEPVGSMAKYLASLQAKTGRIVAATVLGDHGKRHEFEWRGEKQNLRVSLTSPQPGVIDDYTITDLVAQSTARPTPVGTDNRRQTRLDAAVDGVAQLYMQHPETAGLSIAIYQGGKQYFYNYGEVEKGSGRLPTATTYYDMGSVAKTFVGTLLAQAVLDKKVQLTDDIRKYLPGEYPNLAFEGHPVRLMDLVNHTAGIPSTSHVYPKRMSDSLRELPLPARIAYYNQYSADSLLHDMHQFKLTAQPGTAYRYNNLGPLIVQLVLERVYQQPYEQLVTKYVQTRFGMSDTKRVLSAAEQRRYALSYETGKGQVHVNYTGYWGGTTLTSTPADLLKYVRANLSEREPAVRLAHQPTTSLGPKYQVGLAWRLDTDPEGNRRIFHSGHSIGYNTHVVLYPGQDLGFVLLVNEVISQDRLIELAQLLKQALPQAALAKNSAAQ
jgi:CubicO group peptidase (beta-lactamase class C family)